MKEITDQVIKEMGLHIVATVKSESVFNGFQYIVSFKELEDMFGVKVSNNKKLIEDIFQELGNYEEVADVEIDDGFDVVLYTAYAPNYNAEDYED